MQPVIYSGNFNTARDLSRGPSRNVLGSAPLMELLHNPSRGAAHFDDFTEFPHITTPTISSEAAINGKLGYKAFGSSGGTITQGSGADTLSTNKPIGELILTEATDNEGVGLATIALPWKINNSLSQNVAFECRVKWSNLATLVNGTFFGLVATQTLSAIIPIVAAGTLADNNFVGFHYLEANTTNIATVYKADGVTQVTGSDVLAATTTGVLVADTYKKFGFLYRANDHYLNWYVDGIQVGTPYLVTSTAGNPFPNDVNLGMCIATLMGSAATSNLTSVDWWGAAQWTP
jgi:hypothetical protein